MAKNVIKTVEGAKIWKPILLVGGLFAVAGIVIASKQVYDAVEAERKRKKLVETVDELKETVTTEVVETPEGQAGTEAKASSFGGRSNASGRDVFARPVMRYKTES